MVLKALKVHLDLTWYRLAHLLTRSFTYSLAHSFTYLLTHSFTYLLACFTKDFLEFDLSDPTTTPIAVAGTEKMLPAADAPAAISDAMDVNDIAGVIGLSKEELAAVASTD